jgi:uncharacterized lipoprotein NlpE involved in copper resistance
MKKAIFTALLLVLILAGCNGKMSPYNTIRNVLSFQPTAILVADAIYQRWEKKQTDATRIEQVRIKYNAIKDSVIAGLGAIEGSVDLAEEAGKPVDKREVREKIDELVRLLLDFALALEDTVAPAPAPASQPSPGNP